ncbi:hypothetical protein ACFYXS_03200 [Streptomyces sp. NPDC002574]|uniref:hypothetical protein n=1 Tax=Streptomyces sp. NPDC002574 TaxID=3364652 RepID=UPI0036CF0510
MTSIRRNALRFLLGVVASITMGLIGATAASAQPAPDGDIAWSAQNTGPHANDIAW